MATRSPAHLAFGQALRDARNARGLSQAELGSACGLHRTYVGGIERGERNPSYTNILRLSAALEVSGSELLAEAERLSQAKRPRP